MLSRCAPARPLCPGCEFGLVELAHGIKILGVIIDPVHIKYIRVHTSEKTFALVLGFVFDDCMAFVNRAITINFDALGLIPLYFVSHYRDDAHNHHLFMATVIIPELQTHISPDEILVLCVWLSRRIPGFRSSLLVLGIKLIADGTNLPHPWQCESAGGDDSSGFCRP